MELSFKIKGPPRYATKTSSEYCDNNEITSENTNMYVTKLNVLIYNFYALNYLIVYIDI